MLSLRNYLEENIGGLHLEVRAQPAQEGKMGGWEEALGMGMVHGVWAELGKAGIQLVVQGGKKIFNLVREWQKKQTPQTPPGSAYENLSPGITMGDGNKKIYITEDRNGKLRVFDNFNFAIDTKNTYALLVGNSEFGGNFPSIPPVRNNLIDFYNLLTDKLHIGLPRQHVEAVLNKTNNEIEELMLKMSRIPGMETLIIYYSGHGHKVERDSLVLTARNAKKVGDDIVGGIDFNFVTEKVLKRSTAGQKILILDACHSGLATQGEFYPLENFDVKGTYILTSSGDEASYFEKQARHTFFTGTLLDLLHKGVSDETKEMMSLDDLYQFSFQKLVADKFPEPHFKSQLNIPASVFLIARNPAFSIEKLKQRPDILMKDGKLEEALAFYKELVRRFPEDDRLRRKKDQCQDEVTFTQLVHQGDELFHRKNDHVAAAEKYEEALKLKNDPLVIQKLKKCMEAIAPKDPAKPPSPGTTAPIPGTKTGGAPGVATLKKPEPPKPVTAGPVIEPPLPVKESYSYSDTAVTVTFMDGNGKEPLEIPYPKMRELTYVRLSNTVTVISNDPPILHSFKYPKKEDAVKLKNYLVAKAVLKRKPGQKKSSGGELIGAIILWAVICLVFIGITSWAKGYVDDHATDSGVVKSLAQLLAAIGSLITPGVAVVISIVLVIISIFISIDQGKENTEVYTR